MRSLTVEWQRLLNPGGRTCERCGGTQEAVTHAVELLAEVLRPLDIEVKLDVRRLDPEVFAASPAESNRIWIGGRPIEEWIGASVGSSRCGSVCSGSDCRTVEVGGETFETIPETLVLRAGLIAASTVLDERELFEINGP